MVIDMTVPAPLPLAIRAQRIKASEIRELLKLVDRPGMISFAGGIPDPALFNVADFQAAYREVFSGAASARQALQYSATEGHLPLRRWIAGAMAAQGIACGPDNILVTNGSQQALDLIGKLAIDPGSRVLVAAPTYLGALQCFSAYEPQFVPTDFAAADAAAAPARLIYLVPDFANPSGETMDRAARERVLDLAGQCGALVVEDAAYTALRYEGEGVAPIAAIDQARQGSIERSRTLYCGTFSKTLSPSLRIGWIAGPSELIRKLTLIKQGADLHTSTVNQMVMALVAEQSFDAQVERARATYRPRRDAMLAALSRYAPEGMAWSRPEGGLFVWVTLPAGVAAAHVLEKALREDVAFVPGGAFFADGSGRDTLRLSFSLCTEAMIEAGIYKLCALIRQEIADRPVARRTAG